MIESDSGRAYHLDLGMVNAYLVDDGDVTLVDAGTPRSATDLRDELAGAGYGADDLDRILITHFDLDHVGTLADLDTEAPIHAMEPDASYLDGSGKPPVSNHKGLFQRLGGLWLTSPDRPVERVEDGAAVGGFTAYHTPGHSPGHAVYVHEDLGIGLLGDLVAEDGGKLTTASRVLAYSTARNARSVRGLADRNLDFEVAAMGRGEPILEGGSAALSDLAERLR